MNLIELDRALRQLRMSGMAATLETRLFQAQTEAIAHIDLVSMLVSDELQCRSKRWLERRQSAPTGPGRTDARCAPRTLRRRSGLGLRPDRPVGDALP